jgi:hypothetical protein
MTDQPDHTSDPRDAGGAITGPGGPRDRNAVRVDTRNAVLLDGTSVALVEPSRGGLPTGETVYAMTLAGRINRTAADRAEILYLFDDDGAAALITEILALAGRSGRGEVLMADVDRRLAALAQEDALRSALPDHP